MAVLNRPASLPECAPPPPYSICFSALTLPAKLFLLRLSNNFLKARLECKPHSEEEEEATQPAFGMLEPTHVISRLAVKVEKLGKTGAIWWLVASTSTPLKPQLLIKSCPDQISHPSTDHMFLSSPPPPTQHGREGLCHGLAHQCSAPFR